MNANETKKRWGDWFNALNQDIIVLELSRKYHDDLAGYQFSPNNNFYQLLKLWYSNSMVMGIRRHAKNHKESLSFRRLLEDMRDNPKILDSTIDIAGITADVEELKKTSSKCEALADKLVAHLDKKGLVEENFPKLEDLNKAMDCLARLREKYAGYFQNRIIKLTLPNARQDIDAFVNKAIR